MRKSLNLIGEIKHEQKDMIGDKGYDYKSND